MCVFVNNDLGYILTGLDLTVVACRVLVAPAERLAGAAHHEVRGGALALHLLCVFYFSRIFHSGECSVYC
jgi:hypothetical protein